jgi:mono/diheme cytochrome c family protein
MAAVALTGAAAVADAQEGAQRERGLELSQKLCRTCHLVSPGQRGPVPDGIPSFMAMAERPGLDARSIEAALLAPTHPLMPDPPLDHRQRQDVVAYILSLRP